MLKFITISIFIGSLIFGFACGGSNTAEDSQTQEADTSSKSTATSQYGEGVFTIAKGEMSDRRKDHVVLLMPDGKVMVVGGRSSSATQQRVPRLKSAELYDPATEEWTYLAEMINTLSAAGRESPAGSVLKDGRVFITGGQNSSNDPLKTSELYDLATDTWTKGPKPLTWIQRHTHTVLDDGRVIIIGGTDDLSQLKKTAVFDPATDTISKLAEMTTGRSNHTATLLLDGRILVAGGGKRELSDATDTAEIYDPETDTWTSAGRMNEARLSHTAHLLPDGKVLVTGSKGKLATSEVYDPETNSWYTTCSMMTGRSDHSGSLLQDGRVFVSGGEGNLDTTEIYDPSTGEWSPGPKLNVSRNRHRQITMQDGSILITGGQGPEKMSVVVEYFKPDPVERHTGASVLGCGGSVVIKEDVEEDTYNANSPNTDAAHSDRFSEIEDAGLSDADFVFADPIIANPDDDVIVVPLRTPGTIRIGQGIGSPSVDATGTIVRLKEIITNSEEEGISILVNLRNGGWDMGDMTLDIGPGETGPGVKSFARVWLGVIGVGTDESGAPTATVVVFEPGK
ncbi:MAG: hypothetical protein CL887_00295 [Dehalococcoidia bacterium]|nr:hypothetical protein [Dehalococcoidia bacterium]|tara:strand:+ start:8305 stop:10005 length:1701 start_codon:yes stop_codon:yes gene_type:complete